MALSKDMHFLQDCPKRFTTLYFPGESVFAPRLHWEAQYRSALLQETHGYPHVPWR